MAEASGGRTKTAARPSAMRGERAVEVISDPRRHPLPSRIEGVPFPAPVEKLLLAGLYTGVVALLVHGGAPLAGVRSLAGLLGLVLVLNYLFGRHLSKVEPGFVRSTRSQVGMYGAVLIVLGAARFLVDAALVPGAPAWLPHLVPLALATLVARIVHGQRFALEVTTYAGILLAVLLVVRGHPQAAVIEVLAVQLSGALVAAILTGSIRKRSKLVKVGVAIGCAQVITLACFQALVGDFDRTALVFAWLQGLAIGYFVTGSLPMIEALFQVLTDISLLELCNENDQPLLKKLLLTAPGTHHHSFIVGVLGEAAAESVGANPLLCRAGAYYHDIGKMVKPEYFAENQAKAGGCSPHDELEPAMSFLVICSHVKDGVEIGRRYGLHPRLLEFIPTHHGTSLVQYFYHRAMTRSPDDDVDESAFRYSGPRPRTKETGIVNLADAVEASTRSLDHPSPARIRNQVHDIIMNRMMDRQLDETPLTFADLSRIEDAFVHVLVGIFHVRPKCPQITVKG